MKTKMKIAFLSLFTASLIGFYSCGSNADNSENQEHTESTTEQEAVYYCPMKCEGEKTYAEAGSCPVCGMDLVKDD